MIDFIVSNAGMIGLLFFLTLFLAIALWIFRPGSLKKYQKYAYIPLNEDSSI